VVVVKLMPITVGVVELDNGAKILEIRLLKICGEPAVVELMVIPDTIDAVPFVVKSYNLLLNILGTLDDIRIPVTVENPLKL
jgi:hypothetical protein